jgi:hypothetical protein
VADHSQSREWIAQLRRREQARRKTARRRFVDRGPLSLSELGRLDAAELDLLLELLDSALATPRRTAGVHRARSRDGQLSITLNPPEDDAAEAVIQTPRGRLCLRDWTLEVNAMESAPVIKRRSAEQ